MHCTMVNTRTARSHGKPNGIQKSAWNQARMATAIMLGHHSGISACQELSQGRKMKKHVASHNRKAVAAPKAIGHKTSVRVRRGSRNKLVGKHDSRANRSPASNP